ncbi:MAG: hypothetical protein N3A38_16095, partial [Planctomycetota bacterium]|nr:hypothetical protein [Planctomycetota bacterium]
MPAQTVGGTVRGEPSDIPKDLADIFNDLGDIVVDGAKQRKRDRKPLPEDVRRLLASRPAVSGIRLAVRESAREQRPGGGKEPPAVIIEAEGGRIRRIEGAGCDILHPNRALLIRPDEGMAYLVEESPMIESARRRIHALLPYLLLETAADVEARYDAALSEGPGGTRVLSLKPGGCEGGDAGQTAVIEYRIGADGTVESGRVTDGKGATLYEVRLSDPVEVAGARLFRKVLFVAPDGGIFRSIEIIEAAPAAVPAAGEAGAALKDIAIRCVPAKAASEYRGDSADGRFNRGLALMAERKFKEAAAEFAGAAGKAPGTAAFRFYMGLALFRGGRDAGGTAEGRRELAAILNAGRPAGLARRALA